MTTNDTKRQLLNSLLVISETVARIHYGDFVEPVTWPGTPSNARAHVDGLVRSCVRDTHMLTGLVGDNEYRALSAFIRRVETAWASYDVAERHYDPEHRTHELRRSGDPQEAIEVFCSLFTDSLRSVLPILREQQQSEPSDRFFPQEILAGSRTYIEKVAAQACGSYDMGWYDAAAVMARRLLETLIIELYEAKGLDDKIKRPDGTFHYLGGLIGAVLSETKFNISRNSRKSLLLLKDLGDQSAHNRRYIARLADLDNIKRDLRVVIEEFIALAKCK